MRPIRLGLVSRFWLALPMGGFLAPLAAQPAPPVTVRPSGESLFEAYCASCHGLTGPTVGPSLRGVLERTTFDWIALFVRNPQAQLDTQDPRAKALVEKYKVLMPGFPFLSDPEIKSILDYADSVELAADDQAVSDEDTARWVALMDLPTEPIPPSEFSITLEDYVTIPPSSGKSPVARLSNLRFLPEETENQFYVIDQNGPLYRVANGVVFKVMDLAERFPHFVKAPGLAAGFGCFAFHPDFEQNGRIYFSHTEKLSPHRGDFTFDPALEINVQAVISELTVSNPRHPTFAGQRRELLRIDMPHQIHGVQDICFKPNIARDDPDFGLLFIGVGDGGSTAKNAFELGRGLNAPLSSILRIDPLGTNSRNGHYGIPADNPFVAPAKADGRIWPEIYATGFRNPHRLAWEPQGRRRLIATEIGQNSFEEINLIEPGADYGWNLREGFVEFDRTKTRLVKPLPLSGPSDSFTYPVALYSHKEGFAISGGAIYDGDFAPLRGQYIFGDIPSGRLFHADILHAGEGPAQIYELGVREAGGEPTTLRALTGGRRVDLRLGIDAQGQWYVLTKADGKIRRVINWQ